MAGSHSITTTSRLIAGCFTLPSISMPTRFTEADGTISFTLETHAGPVAVVGYGYYRNVWNCQGDISALAAAGLMRHDWCPGLPGNNKTRQAVLFEAAGVRLCGSRGAKIVDAPSILIIRTSKNRYAVEVPATKEQSELLSQVAERGRQRRAAEVQSKLLIDMGHQAAREVNTYHTVPERNLKLIKSMVDAAADAFCRREFAYTPDSTERIGRAMDALQRALASAAFVETPTFGQISAQLPARLNWIFPQQC